MIKYKQIKKIDVCNEECIQTVFHQEVVATKVKESVPNSGILNQVAELFKVILHKNSNFTRIV